MEQPEASRGRMLIPLGYLVNGMLVDTDIYCGGLLLVRAGMHLMQGTLASLARTGVKHVEVDEQSKLAQEFVAEHGVAKYETSGFGSLLTAAAQVNREHGIDTAVPESMLQAATQDVAHFFDQIEKGEQVDRGKIQKTLMGLVGEFLNRPTLAVKLIDLDNFDYYTYRHSINVALLMLSVVQDWYSREEQLIDIVYGALMHDVGKARVGSQIINKQGKLDESEWEVMRMHPVWSEELLRKTEASYTARAIARSHHERLDGSGYPDGLRGEQMVREVRLSGIVDVYDALTTKRSYKPKLDFGAAITLIVKDSGRHFDPTLVNHFIRRVGRYPVGSFVRLSSGDVAVVKEIHHASVARPTVSLVMDARGTLYTPTELNLRFNPRITILSILGPAEHAAIEALQRPEAKD